MDYFFILNIFNEFAVKLKRMKELILFAFIFLGLTWQVKPYNDLIFLCKICLFFKIAIEVLFFNFRFY